MRFAYLQRTTSAHTELHETILDKDIVNILWISNNLNLNLILHNIIAQQPVVVWVKIFLIDERQQATFLVLIKVVLKGQMDVLVLVVLVLVV
jgi:hypothetical protein